MNDENAPDLSLSADAAAARLDVALHELAGVGPAPDLATRVLAAIAAERPGRRALAPTQWLLAATALFGVGIVGAVAWLQRGAASSPATAPVPQDPQPTPTPAPAPKQDPKQEAKQEAKPAPVPAPRGLTWIADYSDNRVIAVDADGKVVEHYDEVYGAWDVEPIGDDRLLVTEFAVSRVREIDRKTKKTVWEFENLKNPYDADRLPNGNTLIADTFGSRVLEIDRDGKIVWSFAKDIRPFDADRLANGNTLIADVLKDRVIEVNAAGEIVWRSRDSPTRTTPIACRTATRWSRCATRPWWSSSTRRARSSGSSKASARRATPIACRTATRWSPRTRACASSTASRRWSGRRTPPGRSRSAAASAERLRPAHRHFAFVPSRRSAAFASVATSPYC